MTKTILFVFDKEGENSGEVKLVETRAEAERLLESLLGAGLPQERIRAFAGDEVPMRLGHRVVVSLGDVVSAESDQASAGSDEEDDFVPPARREDSLRTPVFASMSRSAYPESDTA